MTLFVDASNRRELAFSVPFLCRLGKFAFCRVISLFPTNSSLDISPGRHLNKANSVETEASFSDLNLSIPNKIVSFMNSKR